MIATGSSVKGAKITVLGLTFKEDVPDLRNSKVIDVVRELESYGMQVQIHDPIAESEEAREEYGVHLVKWEDLAQADAIVAAVSHEWYKQQPLEALLAKMKKGGCFVDVKSAFDPARITAHGARHWRL